MIISLINLGNIYNHQIASWLFCFDIILLKFYHVALWKSDASTQ